MNKFKILALILTLFLLLVTTLNIANADSNEDNPVPFLPPFQHSQSQLQPAPQQLQQHQQHINQQPLNSNDLSISHKNQFDNPSPTVTSVMPFSD
jgi:hypothetical protein